MKSEAHCIFLITNDNKLGVTYFFIILLFSFFLCLFIKGMDILLYFGIFLYCAVVDLLRDYFFLNSLLLPLSVNEKSTDLHTLRYLYLYFICQLLKLTIRNRRKINLGVLF